MNVEQKGGAEAGESKGHNSLFCPGPNMLLNACVGRNGGFPGFDRYARGYFEAGARLVESLQDDPTGVDLVIYPLVMNYRHGIEAALKHMMQLVPAFCDKPSKGTPKHKHNRKHKPNHLLMNDWKLVRRLLASLGVVGDDELEQVEGTLTEFVEIDPNGTSFRYPKALDGKVSLQDTTLINVEVFGERMADLADFLANSWEAVDHLYAEGCKSERDMLR
jgi:hypothetical protein